jgi:hypothetical protein
MAFQIIIMILSFPAAAGTYLYFMHKLKYLQNGFPPQQGMTEKKPKYLSESLYGILTCIINLFFLFFHAAKDQLPSKGPYYQSVFQMKQQRLVSQKDLNNR